MKIISAAALIPLIKLAEEEESTVQADPYSHNANSLLQQMTTRQERDGPSKEKVKKVPALFPAGKKQKQPNAPLSNKTDVVVIERTKLAELSFFEVKRNLDALRKKEVTGPR